MPLLLRGHSLSRRNTVATRIDARRRLLLRTQARRQPPGNRIEHSSVFHTNWLGSRSVASHASLAVRACVLCGAAPPLLFFFCSALCKRQGKITPLNKPGVSPMHRFVVGSAAGLRGLSTLRGAAAVCSAAALSSVAYVRSYPSDVPEKHPEEHRCALLLLCASGCSLRAPVCGRAGAPPQHSPNTTNKQRKKKQKGCCCRAR